MTHIQIQVIQGDITNQQVEVLVNAVNSSLRRGGGVDNAIHSAAGERLAEYMAEHVKTCPIGEAVVTPAFDLPMKYLFHAVGPYYMDGTSGEADKLRSAYMACLHLAEVNEIRSIALPCISCGVFGFPVEEAAEIALEVMLTQGRQHPTLEEIRLICHSDEEWHIYQRVFARLQEQEMVCDEVHTPEAETAGGWYGRFTQWLQR